MCYTVVHILFVLFINHEISRRLLLNSFVVNYTVDRGNLVIVIINFPIHLQFLLQTSSREEQDFECHIKIVV